MTLADGSCWVYQYDNLGQVISVRRESAVSSYTVNDLNQHLDRSVTNLVDVFGVANPTNAVVNSVAADRPARRAWAVPSLGGRGSRRAHFSSSGYPLPAREKFLGSAGASPSRVGTAHGADVNLTPDGRWTCVWDGENRLIEMWRDDASPSALRQKLTFEYDWQGRRIRKTVYQGDGNQTPTWTEQSDTVFLYDLSAGQAGGWNLVAELDANVGNAKVRTCVWGNDLTSTMQGAGGDGLRAGGDGGNVQRRAYQLGLELPVQGPAGHDDPVPVEAGGRVLAPDGGGQR